MAPVFTFTCGVISFPDASFVKPMSNVANIDAIAIHIVSRAIDFPAHVLHESKFNESV